MFSKQCVAWVLAVFVAGAVGAFADEHEAEQARVLKAGETIGLNVVNLQGEALGSVDDLIVGPTGERISYLVVSAGGVLGVGASRHPVPIESAKIARHEDDWVVQLDVSEERFREGPTLERDDFTGLTQSARVEQLDAFYGVRETERVVEERVLNVNDLIGMDIYRRGDDRENDALGQLKEIVFEAPSGKIRYGALAFGGFLGFGEKLFAVPWKAVELVRPVGEETVQHLVVTVDVTEGLLEEAEGFSRDNWPARADERWLTGDFRKPAQRVGEREEDIRR